MMNNLPLVLSQVYVTMISATGVFFIMTMGGLDFSQGSILGIASIVVCMVSRPAFPLAIVAGIAVGAAISAINGYFYAYARLNFHRYDLYDVLIPWIYQISDDQRAGSRLCDVNQLRQH